MSYLLRTLRTLAVSALLAPAAASAQTDLFSIAPTSGNADGTGLLGFDLHTLDRPIEITRIGAFDDGQDGFARTITVRLWNRRSGDAIGTAYTFSGSVGTLVGGYRYLELDTPLLIGARTSFGIYSEGYGPGERSVDTAMPPSGAIGIDEGGLLSYELSWILPSGDGVATQTPSRVYGAPTFTFRDASAPQSTVPEPASVALVASGLLALGLGARRRVARTS